MKGYLRMKRVLTVASAAVVLLVGCGESSDQDSVSARSDVRSHEVSAPVSLSLDPSGTLWMLGEEEGRQVVVAVDKDGTRRQIDVGDGWTSVDGAYRPAMALDGTGAVVAMLMCGAELATDRCSESVLMTSRVSLSQGDLVLNDWVAPVPVDAPEAVRALGGPEVLAFSAGSALVDESGAVTLDLGLHASVCPSTQGWVGVKVAPAATERSGSVDAGAIGDSEVELSLDLREAGDWVPMEQSSVTAEWDIEGITDVRCGENGPMVAVEAQPAALAWNGTEWIANDDPPIQWAASPPESGMLLAPSESQGFLTGITAQGTLTKIDSSSGEVLESAEVPQAVHAWWTVQGERPPTGLFGLVGAAAVSCDTSGEVARCEVWRTG